MKDRNLGRDKIDFGNAKIGVLFRSLFFPTLVGMIFMSVATLTDGIFVGRGVGADGIAAVNIVAPIWMVCTGIALMLGIGASVVASIQLSEQNVKAARIILTQVFLVGFAVMSLMLLLCVMFSDEVLYLLGCSLRLEADAMDYLVWILPGLYFLFIQCVGMMLVRLDGSPRYAMWVQIVGSVLNFVLDWVFVFPLEMGVKGAAIATSMSCVVSGLMVLSYFLWFSDKLKFYRLKCSLTSLLLTLRNTWYMVRLGFATLLTELAMSVMMLTGNYMFMGMLGEAGVAAFAVACYLFPVMFSMSNAVAQSAQPIISFNYGAHRWERVNRALWVSLVTAIGCGLFVTVLLCVCCSWVAGMFLSPDEEAYRLAVEGLPLFSICSIFFAVNIAFIGYYQSIERAVTSTMYTLLRGVVLLVPCFILLPEVLGVEGLWLSIPAAELGASVIICLVFLCMRRRQMRNIPHQAEA